MATERGTGQLGKNTPYNDTPDHRMRYFLWSGWSRFVYRLEQVVRNPELLYLIIALKEFPSLVLW